VGTWPRKVSRLSRPSVQCSFREQVVQGEGKGVKGGEGVGVEGGEGEGVEGGEGEGVEGGEGEAVKGGEGEGVEANIFCFVFLFFFVFFVFLVVVVVVVVVVSTRLPLLAPSSCSVCIQFNMSPVPYLTEHCIYFDNLSRPYN